MHHIGIALMLVEWCKHGDEFVALCFVKAGFKAKSVINAADEAILGYILAVYNFVTHRIPDDYKYVSIQRRRNPSCYLGFQVKASQTLSQKEDRSRVNRRKMVTRASPAITTSAT
jgi:hypothetical protein